MISRQLPALKEIVGHESICENIVTLTRCDWSGPASAKLDARHFFWRPKVKLQIRTSCSLRSGLLFSEALGPVPVLKVPELGGNGLEVVGGGFWDVVVGVLGPAACHCILVHCSGLG